MEKIKLNSLAELCRNVVLVHLDTCEETYLDYDYVTLVRNYVNAHQEFRYVPTGDVIEVLKYEGGGEGGAQNCYTILKIGEQFFKVEYQYFSYNGFDLDADYADLYEVFPVEKLVTVYERFRK